jgi:Ser/Thr protein kinase RdoA (MazF antagonist)
MFYYLIGAFPSLLDNRKKEALEWFAYILKGYLAENMISVEQIKNINLFFRMREYHLLSYNLERREQGFGKWQTDLVEGILYRILNDIPFMDVSFEAIYNHCIKA